MVSFKHALGDKSSPGMIRKCGIKPCFPTTRKRPSLVDLQIHEGEFEELFAVEARIATLASAEEQDSHSYLNTTPAPAPTAGAAARHEKKNDINLIGKTTSWRSRFFRSPKLVGTKNPSERRDDNDADDSDEIRRRDFRVDASTSISEISMNDNDDADDRTLAIDYPFRYRDGAAEDSGYAGWLSSVVGEGVMLSPSIKTPVVSESFADNETFVVGRDARGIDNKECGDDQLITGYGKETVEEEAAEDENRLFLWEKTKILADAALRSGNFIAALEMYLVSSEIIARHVEGADLDSFDAFEDVATIGGQSGTNSVYKSKLMQIAWVEAEIRHSIGEVFLYLSKDVAPLKINLDNREEKQQQVRQRQMLEEAKIYLLDSLVAKQGIISNAVFLLKSGAPPCVRGLPFTSFTTKHDTDRMKMNLSVASTLRLLGNVNTDLGMLEEAKAQLRDARNIHLRLVIDVRSMGDECDPNLAWENKLGLALIGYSCGNYFLLLDEINNALEAYNEALDMIAAVLPKSKIMSAALCRAGTVARCGNISDIKIELYTKIGECQYMQCRWKQALLTISKTLNMLNQHMKEKQCAPSNCTKPKRCDCAQIANEISSRRIIFNQLLRVYILCTKVYTSVEDHDEASKAREEAQRAKEEVLREQSPEAAAPSSILAHILEHVGDHYQSINNNKMALKTYRVALELCEDNSKATSKHGIYLKKYWNTDGSDPHTECRLLQKVATIHSCKDEYGAALAAYRRAISVRIHAASLQKKPEEIIKGDYFRDSLLQDNNGLIKRRINISHHDRDFITSLHGIEGIAIALESLVGSKESSEANSSDNLLASEQLLNLSETPFRNALDLLVQVIIGESISTDKVFPRSIAAVVLYRVGMALWKKDKKLEHALASMVKCLEQMITAEDLGLGSEVSIGTTPESSTDDELFRVNKADVLESVGGIHVDLGNFEEAKLAIIGALQEQQTIIMRRDDDEEKYVARWKIARLSMKAGMLHSKTYNLDKAEQLLRNALNIVERASPHPEEVGTGVKIKTNRDFFDAMEADILHQLGLTLARKHDNAGALDAYNEAKSTLERAGKKPDHPKIRKLDEDMKEASKAGNTTDKNSERWTTEETTDFAALDSYEDNSSLSTTSEWNEYDRIADDLACGMPCFMERFTIADC